MPRPLLPVSLFVAGMAAAPLAGAQAIPPAQPPGPHVQPLATPDVIDAISQAGAFEVQEGRLAARRAQSGAVRAAAQAMVRDHARIAGRLAAAVRREGLPAPRPPGLGLGQHQALQQLQGLSGAAFDRAYVDAQIRLQARLLAQMQAYEQTDEPGPVRRTAHELTPVIARDLAMFRRLHTS